METLYKQGKLITWNTTVFYSVTDTSFERVAGWSDLTSGNTDFNEIGDNHFLLNQYYDEMAELINTNLKTDEERA